MKDMDMTSEVYKLKPTVGSNSMVAPQKVIPIDLMTIKIERWGLLLDQGCYDPPTVKGVYSFPYSSLSTITASVSDCIPSDNEV